MSLIKSYRELSNEYREGVKELGSLPEKEYAKRLKLIKRLKQVRADMDKISKENQKDQQFLL